MSAPDLQAAILHSGYAAGEFTPEDVVRAVHRRITEEAPGGPGVWLDLEPLDAVLAAARSLPPATGPGGAPTLPLYGLPFAVKDNVDVAGRVTTAGCPGYGYRAQDDATLVARLRAAGAVYLGKLNLDQFATGLVGTRTPYGVPRNPFDPQLVPGGSSSGSGVAVATGLVTFAIGTDTAGSGRVPAALTNTVGLKPSRGLVSTAGIVPACRSLDCPSVHALSVDDAWRVLQVIAGTDPADPWTRELPLGSPDLAAGPGRLASARLGVPSATDVARVCSPAVAAGFERTRARLAGLGAVLHDIDLGPFFEAGDLLYGGPWVAERWSGLAGFVTGRPDDVLPVTRGILTGGATFDAAQTFTAMHRLQQLRAVTGAVLAGLDALMLPTITRRPTLAEVAADPVGVNAALGRWTTFCNLLDLAAVAVPQELGPPGSDDGDQPFGVMVLAGAGRDAEVATLGAALHRAAAHEAPARPAAGATGHPLAAPAPVIEDAPVIKESAVIKESCTPLVVAGAHMTGLPLHPQLEALGARFRETVRTAPVYRMVALDGPIPRPGLIRQADGSGGSLEVEVHELSHRALGELMVTIKPPLAIGTVSLDDGRELPGFVCEGHAAAWAPDVTETGGWRAHLAGTVDQPA